MVFLLCAAANIAGAATSSGTIKGTITDASRGTALPSIVAAAYSPTGELQGTAPSDSKGEYILNLPAGRYRVLAYDINGAFATEFGGNADSFDTSPIVNLTSTVSGVNFAMEKAGTVSGTVTSATVPLSSITVVAYNVSSGTRRGFTQSAANGMYSLALAPGQYKIAAYDTTGTYAVAFFPNSSIFTSATALSLTSTQQITANFDLPLAAHLAGKVVDSDTNMVLGASSVFAYLNDGTLVASALSDAAGNFSLSVGPGSYKIVAADVTRVYASGFVDDANSFANEHTFTVNAGQSAQGIRIPLHRAGAVAGRVTDAAGAPLAGINVAAYNNDGSERALAVSDASGTYALILPPGSFRAAAFDSSRVFVTQFYPRLALFSSATPVAVNVAQTTPAIDFSLGRGARFNGTIIDGTNRTPIDGISVAAYDDAGNLMNLAVTDAAGDYILVVPSGRFKLTAFDDRLRYITGYSGGSPDYDNAIDYQAVGTGTVRVDFALTQGIHVTGTVSDSTAAFDPVSSIEVGALDADGNRVATATAHDGRFDLVLAPGTYRLLATDPLGRYYASFYNGAWTLQTASPIVVGVNGVANPIAMTLLPVTRRHAVHH